MGLHPATMQVMKDYIATGTQLKVERPGKATAITPCSTIEGPIVKLNNGNVVQIENTQQIKENKEQIKEILIVGDILFTWKKQANKQAC